jgi:hypothetical protein
MSRLQALQRWQNKMIVVDWKLDDLVRVLNVNPESELLQAVWDLQAAYTKEIEDSFGLGSNGWLEWYAHENGYGAKGLEAGKGENLRPIQTLEDLLWVINLN